MIKQLTILITILLLLSCKVEDEKEFEGVITYKIDIQCDNPEALASYKNAFGTKINYYFKKGDFRREFYSLDDKLVRTTIYKEKTNTNYHNGLNNDTITFQSAGIENCKIETIKSKKDETTILDLQCDYNKFKISNDTIVYMNYKMEFWTNSEIIINSDRFMNFKDGGFDYILSKTKSLPLKYSMDIGMAKIIYTATKIDYSELKDELFSIDESKPLKEWNK